MPLVTVVCPAFMHEKYIADALESFVKQKTKFKFQVLVCDDKSTDKTSEIIEEYAQKYPEIIKPVYKEKKGNNWLNLLSLINTKYAVINDGDDYFTNPYKLQKQVNFLEENPDFSISFHNVRVIKEGEPDFEEIFPAPKLRFYKTELEFLDLICHNFIQTNSCMYRWRYNDTNKIADEFPSGKDKWIMPYDHWVHLLHAEVGKIGFMPDIMSVYRLHKNGVWQGANKSHTWYIKYGLPYVRFWELCFKRFGYGKVKGVDIVLSKIKKAAEKEKNKELLKKVNAKIKERESLPR